MRALALLITLPLPWLALACQGSSSAGAPPPASAGVPAPMPMPGPTPGPPPSAASAPTSGPAGTVSVQQMQGMMPGSHAVVRGVFFGWRGPCRGRPPTRSAWQIADGDQPGAPCLYVDGPMPPGANAAAQPPPDVWVRVDGTLQASGPDRFVAAQHVEREP